MTFDDPVIGIQLSSVDQFLDGSFPNLSPAKLVDLDVYQQGVSTIYGLRLQLADNALSWFCGTMDPARLNSLWFNAVLPTRGWEEDYGWSSYGGDGNACGRFQSVIRVAEDRWTLGKSRVIDELHHACAVEVDSTGKPFRLLSFRLVLDGYENVASSGKSYRQGRLTGAIGPYLANEPRAVVANQRWLVPRKLPDGAAWYVPTFYGAPFVLDQQRKCLVIDLADSLCRETAGGVMVDLGTLSAVVGNTPLATVVLGTIGNVQFAYENNAGIAEVPLSDEHFELVQSMPLQLMTSRTDIGSPYLLSEDPSGLAYAVDDRVVYMTSEPGSRWREMSSRVYFTQWGRPNPGQQLQLLIQPVKGGVPNATVPRNSPGDTSSAIGALVASISASDPHGFATILLQSTKDPGSRTPQLDGQLYFVYPCPDPQNPLPSTFAQERLLSVLMWSSYPINENPTWDDIRAIMVPYAKLYPAMTSRIDLTDLHTFTIFSDNPPWSVVYKTEPNYNVLGISRGAIPFYMSRDREDPRFMPVSRDLSPNKITTILHFCKRLQARVGAAANAPATATPASPTRDVS